jgi:hypothetical protein
MKLKLVSTEVKTPLERMRSSSEREAFAKGEADALLRAKLDAGAAVSASQGATEGAAGMETAGGGTERADVVEMAGGARRPSAIKQFVLWLNNLGATIRHVSYGSYTLMGDNY